jgi:hypothetical protein
MVSVSEDATIFLRLKNGFGQGFSDQLRRPTGLILMSLPFYSDTHQYKLRQVSQKPEL